MDNDGGGGLGDAEQEPQRQVTGSALSREHFHNVHVAIDNLIYHREGNEPQGRWFVQDSSITRRTRDAVRRDCHWTQEIDRNAPSRVRLRS